MQYVYLAGPMTGYPEFNFPMFNYVAEQLRTAGYTVFNPAQKDIELHGEEFTKSEGFATGDNVKVSQESSFDLRETFRVDMEWICNNADSIVLLPGWTKSNGARAEYFLSKALGNRVEYWEGTERLE